MKKLTATLDYASTDYAPSSARHHSPLALPLRVLDADGSIVAEGVASNTMPATFDLSTSTSDEPLFVRLTWPSGKTQTKRVEVQNDGTAVVHFDNSSISRNEWSAWAVPRLNERTVLAQPDVTVTSSIDRFDRVWLRMWRFESGRWGETPLPTSASYRNNSAHQLDFELPVGGWLLQFGGSRVPWRFVALPGGGPCRVLLTPNNSKDPRAEPLKAIVTSFRLDAETLLEFLSRDAIGAATAVANFQPLAIRLLAEKTDDPVSAVAGAYFLMRTEGWRSIPTFWFDNLNGMFPWIADAAVIRCALTIRQGLPSASDEERAVGYLRECVNRGVPMFAEGLSLLQESSSVLGSSPRAPEEGVFRWIESLAASRAWAGAALSFYGEAPDRPSPDRLLGLPGQSRLATRIAGGARPIPEAGLPNEDAAIGASKRPSVARKRAASEEGLVFLGELNL